MACFFCAGHVGEIAASAWTVSAAELMRGPVYLRTINRELWVLLAMRSGRQPKRWDSMPHCSSTPTTIRSNPWPC